MANKFLNYDGLLYFWQKVKTLLAGKVDTVSGKGLSTNDYTTAEKTKLSGIATGANAYTLPTASASTLGGVKTTSTVTSTSGLTAAPIISGVPYYKDTNTTYSAATTSANGLMTAADKTKLDGVATGANKYTLPAATEDTLGGVKITQSIINSDQTEVATAGAVYGKINSVNAIVNGYVSVLNDKVNKVDGKGLSTNDYTTAEKTKLAGFASADSYALKTDIASAYKYKGSVSAYSALPTSGQTAGDVYNVESDGMNYAWTGTAWDALGGTFDAEAITNAEIDTIMSSR